MASTHAAPAAAAAVGGGQAVNTAIAAVAGLNDSVIDIPSLDDSFIRKLPDDPDAGEDASDAGGGSGGGEEDDDADIEIEVEEDEACESEGEDDTDAAAEADAAAAAAAAAAAGVLVTSSPSYTRDEPTPAGLLSALVPCPFGTFEPTIRFAYEGDGVTLEQFPAEIKKLLKWYACDDAMCFFFIYIYLKPGGRKAELHSTISVLVLTCVICHSYDALTLCMGWVFSIGGFFNKKAHDQNDVKLNPEDGCKRRVQEYEQENVAWAVGLTHEGREL